jgi:mono/diheme cytochrome c family protein
LKNNPIPDDITDKMKSVPAFLCLLLPASGLLISGCASRPVAKQEANYPVEKVNARALFVENCSICHGTNGKAHTFHGWLVGARNLTRAQWQDEATDEEILNAIKTGPRVMPAFEKILSPTEIDALAAYVRTLSEKN